MLSMLRKAARSWVAAILIGLLIVSFALFGINDVFRGAVGNDVAVVDGQAITPEEYRAEFDRILKGMSEQSGREITTAEAREQGLDRRALDEMVSERTFAAYTGKLGIAATEEQLRDQISGIEAFQDPATRQFSQAAYQAALQRNGLDTITFETRLRSDLARQLLMTAAIAGMKTPNVIARQTLAYATERRRVTVIPVPASLVGAPATPTDAQINALYEELKPQIMLPEHRDLTVVVAAGSQFAGKVTVDEAQIRRVFEQQKDRLGTPAQYSFVQIVAPDQAKATEAANRLRRGEAADAVARALSLAEPLTFTDQAARTIRDSKVAEAVVAARTGDIVAVNGSLGWSAVRVTGSRPAVAATYEAFAPQAREQFRQQAAAQLMTEASEAYDTAIEEGASPADAARRAGFQVLTLAGVTAQGASVATGQPVPELAGAEALLTAAFALAQGDSTELTPAGQDSYMAATVTKVTAAAPRPLAEIRPDVAREWQRRDLTARVEARAKTVLEAAKKDGFEQAARAANLQIMAQPQPLQRGQGGQALTNAVFGAKKGEIVMAAVANGVDFAIIRIDAIERDDETAAADRLVQVEQQTRQTLQTDLVAVLQALATAAVDVRTWPERIARVFGDADPAAEGSADAGAAIGAAPGASPATPAPPADPAPATK